MGVDGQRKKRTLSEKNWKKTKIGKYRGPLKHWEGGDVGRTETDASGIKGSGKGPGKQGSIVNHMRKRFLGKKGI